VLREKLRFSRQFLVDSEDVAQYILENTRKTREKPPFASLAQEIPVSEPGSDAHLVPCAKDGRNHNSHGPNHTTNTIAKKPMKAKATSKPKKIAPASKPRSKGEFYTTIADQMEMPRKQVASMFDAMGRVLAADLGKGGPGLVNVAGLMKVTVVRKPATKARKGINPFTKQEVMFKAKPARNVIKVRPLKSLKGMV
jgi:nucleoid DNA-binding protein